MWRIGDLKFRGMAAMKRNYGSVLACSLLMSFVLGGTGATTSSSSLKDVTEKLKENPNFAEIVIIALSAMAILIALGIVFNILVANPLYTGCRYFFSENTKGPAPIGIVGRGFKPNWKNVVLTMFLTNLFEFLWFMLFIIPGFVKIYSYRLVPYIIADNPELSGTEAITISRRMMNGHKWHSFLLDLSFIGWDILCILTLGILAVFYVAPYKNCTDAELYNTLKNAESITVNPSDISQGTEW